MASWRLLASSVPWEDPGPSHALTSTAPAADPCPEALSPGRAGPVLWQLCLPGCGKLVVSVLPCSKHLIFYNIDRPRLLRQPSEGEQLDYLFYNHFKNPEINLKLFKK